jgi:hypothetical protein
MSSILRRYLKRAVHSLATATAEATSENPGAQWLKIELASSRSREDPSADDVRLRKITIPEDIAGLDDDRAYALHTALREHIRGMRIKSHVEAERWLSKRRMEAEEREEAARLAAAEAAAEPTEEVSE